MDATFAAAHRAAAARREEWSEIKKMQPIVRDDNVFDFNALLHPGTVFAHPREVVAHPRLSLAEKRAILSSWVSDASAIASCPSLRSPERLKGEVLVEEIMEALAALDGAPCHPTGPQHPPGGKPNRLRSVDRALAA